MATAWLAMLGFDLLLHGGLLARFYLRDSPFLLDPPEAFRRIPVGYLSFLLLAILLHWLLTALDTRGWWAGFRVGLGAGALVWISGTLGLWSITTAEPDLLAFWALGQTVGLGIGGGVLGLGLAGTPLKGLLARVLLGVAAAVIVTIVLQSTGLAPGLRVPGP